MTQTTRERWDRIKAIFEDAVSREPEERSEFLAAACAQDPALRAEVESLLKAHDAAGAFLEHSAFEVTAGVLGEEPEAGLEGLRVGPYRIVREIGRGGMGTVVLAEREGEEFRRRVAIKLISHGMDTDAIVRRFRQERQILAGLDHPYIGRLFDGGATDDGRSYFVMEYVEGERIDAYCKERHLSVEERIGLFCKVCEAVQYAHRHLIVHRDLKPANILVTAEGVPKLLDFGLAKLVDPEAGEGTQTVLGMAMTPEYASPEQVRGEPLTTATDVYSLGVILYEVLTGGHPYPFPTRRPDVVARMICEQEPPLPSAKVEDPRLRRRLRGDLDTIVGMALRKLPERRYVTVDQLADDLRHHLQGVPVAARRDTLVYRGGKFVRRHRIAVGAAALLLLTLLVGIGTTTWQMRVANAERERAEERFNDVRRLARLFIFDYNAALHGIPGTTPIRERMVRDAFSYLELLSREAEDDPSLQAELAEGYDRIGEVQARMGDIGGSLASHRRALALHRRLAAARPDDVPILRAQAFSYEMVADRLTDTGDAAGALGNHREALEIREGILRANPADAQALRDVWSSTFYVGRALQSMGAYDEALAEYREMTTMSDSMLAAAPDDPERLMNSLTSHHTLGNGLAVVGDLAGAAREYRRAVAMSRDLSASNPVSGDYRQALSRSNSRLARILGLMGDHEGALPHLEEARGISERMAGEDPSNAETKHDLITIHALLGQELAAMGRTAEALSHYQTAIAVGAEQTRRDPEHARTAHAFALARRGLGDLYLQTGDVARVIEIQTASVEMLEDLSARDSTNVDLRQDLAEGWARLARAYEERAGGDADRRAACEAYGRSVEVWNMLERSGMLSPSRAGRATEAQGELDRCEPQNG